MATVKTRLPAIFFGHGNPMNALGNNRYASAWAALGAGVPRPRAVRMDGGCVSMLAVQFG